MAHVFVYEGQYVGYFGGLGIVNAIVRSMLETSRGRASGGARAALAARDTTKVRLNRMQLSFGCRGPKDRIRARISMACIMVDGSMVYFNTVYYSMV